VIECAIDREVRYYADQAQTEVRHPLHDPPAHDPQHDQSHESHESQRVGLAVAPPPQVVAYAAITLAATACPRTVPVRARAIPVWNDWTFSSSTFSFSGRMAATP
jgi:hypothetical protein